MGEEVSGLQRDGADRTFGRNQRLAGKRIIMPGWQLVATTAGRKFLLAQRVWQSGIYPWMTRRWLKNQILDWRCICQSPAGWLFHPVNERNGKRELWAQMIMLWCLQSYYEYSQDQRVIDLMTNYFKWQMTVPDDQLLEDYWEKSRGGDNIISIYWLYNHTGDAFLLN